MKNVLWMIFYIHTLQRISSSFSNIPTIHHYKKSIIPNEKKMDSYHFSCTKTKMDMNHHASIDKDNENKIIKIALTREDGKNKKIWNALESHPQLRTLCSSTTNDDTTSTSIMTMTMTTTNVYACDIIEIPCIEHADGPDSGEIFLSELTICPSTYDYITITSPEAAQVFASTWEQTQLSKDELPSICAVGKATQQALEKRNIPVSFVPSKATAATLVNELPPIENKKTTNVLYPASAKAKLTLQKGLQERRDASFEVKRLDTYDTVPAKWTDEQYTIAKESIQIVCFASPSAVESWVSKVNEEDKRNRNGKELSSFHQQYTMAACIGETSAQACREFGWEENHIFYPDKPGVNGWAESVVEAVEQMYKKDI